MSDRKLEVLVFGLGAIGSFYALIIGRNENVSLSLVARSNYEAIKSDGLKIESENHGNQTVRYDHIYKSPSEAGRKFDYIVCTHKAVNIGSFPPLFKDVADERTTFVLLQNGVGNEDPFREAYPRCSIISGVVWVGAIPLSPAVIQHWKNENTHIGLFPNSSLDEGTEKKRLDVFCDLFTKGKTPFTVESNVQIKRWEKVVWNVAINGITTLSYVDLQKWLKSSEEAIPMTRRLMTEVAFVARASGVPLDDDLVDRWMAFLNKMPAVFSSMYVDTKEGRPLEADVILGVPMRKAKELGIEVPMLSVVYSLIMAIDGRIRESKM